MEQASAVALLGLGLVLSFGIGFLAERFLLSQILRTLTVRDSLPPLKSPTR
jgi:hypothetical protein